MSVYLFNRQENVICLRVFDSDLNTWLGSPSETLFFRSLAAHFSLFSFCSLGFHDYLYLLLRLNMTVHAWRFWCCSQYWILEHLFLGSLIPLNNRIIVIQDRSDDFLHGITGTKTAKWFKRIIGRPQNDQQMSSLTLATSSLHWISSTIMSIACYWHMRVLFRLSSHFLLFP